MKHVPLFKVGMSKNAHKKVKEVLTPDCNGVIYCGEGPLVKEFENKFWELNPTHARPLFVNSCTSAITLALTLCDVKPGDEVITTPQTCLATNHPILAHFATPVWADIDPKTGLIDPNDVAKKITSKTKAIIAVDWSGAYCDYNLLKKFNIPVIQDAAHCLKIDKDNCGDFICWSTQAIKFLTTADGGFLSVPQEFHEEARLRRWFSLDREASADFRCAQNAKYVGFKFQATDIDAAIGLSNINIAVKNQKKHARNAKYFNKNIKNSKIIKPVFKKSNQWWLYTILVPEKREEFIKYLLENGISSSQVHSRNDQHDVFEEFKKDLPGTDSFSKNQLSIPVGWWLTKEEREHIVNTINNWNG
jgi:dTDP-4-amino-4,6-dideoxygalactose transaminase